MKLRLRANTLRLRLTRSEVDAIGQGRPVVEDTRFPNGSVLRYSLVPGGESVVVRHRSEQAGSLVEVCVPLAVAERWATSDAVGIGEGPILVGSMQVLIEKDFDCLAPRPGDEAIDTFPNPAAAEDR